MTRAADDSAATRARVEELRCEREQAARIEDPHQLRDRSRAGPVKRERSNRRKSPDARPPRDYVGRQRVNRAAEASQNNRSGRAVAEMKKRAEWRQVRGRRPSANLDNSLLL
jgi:hypothetical protein